MTQPPKSRRRAPYHHGNLPSALAAAARELIEQQGTDALTLRAVARRVGVTHAAPYRHFKDKQALLDAVAEGAQRELAEALQATIATAPVPVEACGRCYLAFAREHTALFRLMFSANLDDDDSLRNCFADAFRASVSSKAGGEKLLASADAAAFSGALWALWHGLAMLAIDGRIADVDAVSGAIEMSAEMIHRQVTSPPRSTLRPSEESKDKQEVGD